MWKESVHKRGKGYIRDRFWSNTRHIKGRIFRCVWRKTVRNIKHYKIWWKLRSKYHIPGKGRQIQNSKIKTEESFPISEQGYTIRKLLDGTECQILLDTGASTSFMSKSYYMCCKSLHSLPKFTSQKQRIHVGNCQFVSVLFIIPVIVDIHRYWFHIYTLVSEIHENVDLVLGINNVLKLEGVITHEIAVSPFWTDPYTFFPKEHIVLKPKEQKLIRVKAPIYRWDIWSSNYQNAR